MGDGGLGGPGMLLNGDVDSPESPEEKGGGVGREEIKKGMEKEETKLLKF